MANSPWAWAKLNIVQEFFSLERQIWALVGEDTVQFSGLIDISFEPWEIRDDEVSWGVNEYSIEVYGTAIFEGPVYTIIVGYDGQGSGPIPHIFTNKLRR